jgi:hypothetical protein
MDIHVHAWSDSMSSHLNFIHSPHIPTIVVHPRLSPFSVLLIPLSCLVAGKADISDLNVSPTLPSYSVYVSSSCPIYSYQNKRSSTPFRAHTRRFLRLHQYRFEEALEITRPSSIIRQIRCVGRYRDLVKSIMTFRYDSGTEHPFVDHYTRYSNYRWRSEYPMSSVEC